GAIGGRFEDRIDPRPFAGWPDFKRGLENLGLSGPDVMSVNLIERRPCFDHRLGESGEHRRPSLARSGNFKGARWIVEDRIPEMEVQWMPHQERFSGVER